MRQGSLREILEVEEPLPVERVIAVAEAALEALAALHERGVIHRDVKVSNLLVAEDGRIKLGDLGLVRRGEAPPDLTRTGVTVGTPLYMSPEQLRGDELTPASDLYSLGVTLHRLLTGRHPFAVSSEYQAVDAHLHGRPEPVRRRRPDCPRWLAAFVRRLLEKRPSERWPDANAALADLRRRRVVSWRRVGLWAAAASIVLATVTLTGWLLAARPTLSRVVRSEDTLVGLDSGGKELWRRDLDGVPSVPVVADLVGSGEREVGVGLYHPAADGAQRPPELLVLSGTGRTLFRSQIGQTLIATVAPWLSDDVAVGWFWSRDVNADGRQELLCVVGHHDWYPSELAAWNPANGGRVPALLVNSGHIDGVDVADVNGDGAPELLVSGINNQLGYQHFVAVLRGGVESLSPSCSPDLVTEWGPGEGTQELMSYTLLGPITGMLRVDSADTSGIVVDRGVSTERLTPWGMPADSPAAAADGSEILAFWRAAAIECRKTADEPSRAVLTMLRARYPRFMADARLEVAVRLTLARTLAGNGAIDDAVGVLEAGRELDKVFTDLALRRGELLLIRGDRERGREAVAASMVGRETGRGSYDATLILGLDAALAVDRSMLQATGRLARSVSVRMGPGYARITEAAFAFCAGQWYDSALGDESLSRYFPPVAVLQLWARVERGEVAPDEVMSIVQSLSTNTERRDPAHLLEASLRLRRGEVEASASLAREALENLRRRGHVDYPSHFFVPLAELVYGEALLAQGDDEDARPHLALAARLAPAAWFGEEAAARLAR